MNKIALGTTVFKRTEKLQDLLESVDSKLINKVYIGDVGHTKERQKIYEKDYPFDLQFFDLEYDSGLGASRDRIVNELQEDYLLIVDNDVTLPDNIDVLKKQLERSSELGGIGGILIEDGKIRSGCCDIYECQEYFVKHISKRKEIKEIGDSPIVFFDQIQNVALFKKECLEDYSWDPEYTINKEHEDFFVGHKKNTKWKFGVCPEVLFRHYPGGSEQYDNHRNSRSKYISSEEYFLNKWNFKGYVRGNPMWIDSYTPDDGLLYICYDFLLKILALLPLWVEIYILILLEYANKNFRKNG